MLAFPSNQFGAQEPGSNEEIQTFACSRYKATFPMFSKVPACGVFMSSSVKSQPLLLGPIHGLDSNSGFHTGNVFSPVLCLRVITHGLMAWHGRTRKHSKTPHTMKLCVPALFRWT